MSTLIFDFDGTLADTWPLVADVSYKLTGVTPLPNNGIDLLRRLPLLKAVRELGIPWWYIPKLALQTKHHMYPRMNEVKAFPGMVQELERLYKTGHRLFILSSNDQKNIQVFLRQHHLEDYFSGVYGVFYGNVFYKKMGFRKILRQNHLRAADCYYIGNESLDIHAAKQVGMKAIGVTWSGQDRGELEAERPQALIDQPKQLSTVTI
ncbi:MAG TPA: HAD hydrolase-like protein [Nevskiaceae bacterium]|nr:HAD hydrolase-like protein [Nevskiaceae bacterium]